MDFRYRGLPWNIVFGVGSLERLPAEMDGISCTSALVLTTPAQASDGHRIADLLGDRCVGLFDRAAMHVPARIVLEGRDLAGRVGADCTVSIGGGSTTGLGKALALRANLDNVAIPTTYAGSEMTDIWGITQDGRKVTGRDPRVVPTLTIYDPALTLSLPPALAAASGLNALAQAAVNIATNNANPIVKALALDAVRAISRSLPRILESPENLEARTKALYGASLAGAALGTGKTGLHHRLCHVLGGALGTPHAETHAVLLPHSIAYNAGAASEGTAELASALGVENAPLGIHELAVSLGAPTSLREIGVGEADLDRVADMAVEAPLENPETVTAGRVRKLLDDAYHGRLR